MPGKPVAYGPPNKPKSRKNRKKKTRQANPSSNQTGATPFGDSGRIVGRKLANLFGRDKDYWGKVGRGIGSGVGGFFGSGQYKLKENVCWSNQVPVMHSNDESVIFRHRELICDINESVLFTINTFQLNPGLSTTFPFLSNIAQNFQEYHFNGLIFEYKSTAAMSLVSGTNIAMGTIMMGAQYRADADNFVNKQQF